MDTIASSYKETHKYIGEEYDESTGLSYLNARYYNGARGRFISQDPKFIEMNDYDFLFDPQQMNSYSYGRNNPLKYIDPEGEKVELVGRTVVNIGKINIGTHNFYHITPNNPNQIISSSLHRYILSRFFIVHSNSGRQRFFVVQ